MPNPDNDKDLNQAASVEPSFTVKKLSGFFVDEIANISIAPNGACRLNFATWGTDNEGNAQRIDSEVILTIQTLKALSEALPKAIERAEAMMTQRQERPAIKGTVQ